MDTFIAKIKELIPSYLAVIVTIGFFSIVYILIFHAEPTSNERLLDTLFGVLVGKFGSVIDYHFGSSSGSAAKTAIMASSKAPTP